MAFHDGRMLRVVLRATAGALEVVNVLHYDCNDSTWPAHDNDPQALADLFRDSVIPAYKPLFTSGWSVQPVSIIEEKDPQNPDAPRDAWTSGSPVTGTHVTVAGADDAPDELCGMATLLTGKVGRSFRGRIFLPPIWNKTYIQGDTILPAGLTAYQTFLNAIPLEPDIVTGVSPSTCELSVYSRTRRARDADTYASKVTSINLGNRVRWLRSRSESA